MNPFQTSYGSRLREWKILRLSIPNKSLEDTVVNIDRWWQQAPLVNHHLHPLDPENWPDPWTLLSDNVYCTLTRGIGVCYTLLMGGITDFILVEATNKACEEHNLVIVDHAKYILNYYPNTVLSTDLNEFKIARVLSTKHLVEKIK